MMQSRNTEQGALSVLRARGVSIPFLFVTDLVRGPQALAQRQGEQVLTCASIPGVSGECQEQETFPSCLLCAWHGFIKGFEEHRD